MSEIDRAIKTADILMQMKKSKALRWNVSNEEMKAFLQELFDSIPADMDKEFIEIANRTMSLHLIPLYFDRNGKVQVEQ